MNILSASLLLLQMQLAVANGIVTKPGGNEPLPKASVSLLPVAPGQNFKPHSTVTDEDGRFALRDIEPGDYRLTAESDRYGQAAYGQRKPGGPGSILSITAGQQLSNLRISMIPTGTIAGRITGRNGEPFVNAAVQAFKYGYENGKKKLITAQSTTTDDRGEYRLFWLPAGQYVVAASKGSTSAQPTAAMPMRPGSSGGSLPDFARQAELQAVLLFADLQPSGNARLRILEDGTMQEEAWAPVYYPATTEARFAAAIDVAAGATRNGVDMVIGPARIQSVRGRVAGFSPDSMPSVTLVPQDSSGFRIPVAGKGASTIDGSFAFTGALPGDYFVVAHDRRGGVGAPVAVHVGDGDVENLIVGIGQPVSVTGRVVVEAVATDTTATSTPAVIYFALSPSDFPIASLASTNIAVDARTGSFVLNNLAPGEYLVQISAGGGLAAKPLYVKSARLGLADITPGLRIEANTTDRIEIVLTADPGSVEGIAIDARGAPATNATVVLVPNIARKRSDLYKSVVTGADGRFRFQSLTPGDYKLFAWDDIETGAWQDPDFIRTYESKGLPVRIAEKSKGDVQLTVINNP